MLKKIHEVFLFLSLRRHGKIYFSRVKINFIHTKIYFIIIFALKMYFDYR